MSILYDNILWQAALRVSALKGVTSAARETNLAVSPLTATQIGTVEFPFTAIKNAVLSNVARLVRAYASTKNHPFRQYNLSQTANLANKAVLPSVNSASKPIVGVWGAVRDATTGEICTKQPLQVVRSLKANADNFLKGNYYHYDFVDGRIEHTRTNVAIDVCTFDRATESTAMDATNGVCPLPDALFDAAWFGTLEFLVVDDAYVSQTSLARNYIAGVLSEIKQGATVFSPAPEQVPIAAIN